MHVHLCIHVQSKELQATQARLQRLRDEEDKLRQQLQVIKCCARVKTEGADCNALQLGKDKLGDLIDQLKKVNADVTKVEWMYWSASDDG
jgi:hypothetical protein